MIWGYAGIWHPAYTGERRPSLMARLEFLVRWGLQCTGTSAAELDRMAPSEREAVFEYIAEHNLHLTLAVWSGILLEAGESARRTEAGLRAIECWRHAARAPIVTTGAGQVHRFIRDPPLERQLDLLADRLAPLVRGCRDLGLPVGIENHGDYYVADLLQLCGRVPGLGIFLDTGNCYLIGEPPLPAIAAAAPFTVGTHFKDHHVSPRPDARPLHFEVAPAVLGEGDVGLAEAYRLLVENAPNSENLVMEVELVQPPDLDPVEALERSLTFTRKLSA